MLKGWLGVVLLLSALNVNGAGVHQHGVGHLYMAIEGDNLQLLMSLPAEDLVVTKTSASQQSSVQLLMSEPPLSFDAEDKCRLLSANIEAPQVSHDARSEHNAHDAHSSHDAHSEHHSHDEHGSHDAHSEHDSHDAHSEQGSHDSHETNDSHNTHADGGHSDVEINYLWQCSGPVSTAKTSLFKRFPGLYKINVQILSKNQQKVQSLTSDNPNLKWH